MSWLTLMITVMYWIGVHHDFAGLKGIQRSIRVSVLEADDSYNEMHLSPCVFHEL
jgi:hypothetical protein